MCRQLRAFSDTPVLMLTARGEPMDRVDRPRGGRGRLPAQAVRAPRAARAAARDLPPDRPGDASSATLRFGRLEIDRDARAVRLDGAERSLTAHQFALLVALAERAGRVLSREALMDLVRGEDLDAFDRSIDVHVSRIRAVIEDDPKAAAPPPHRARGGLRLRPAAGLMRRLYLRIYAAVLASLVAFALVAGLLWHLLGAGGPGGYAFEVAGVLAQNVLPPVDAPAVLQQAALERLAANLRADVGLFAADRSPLASVGGPVPAPGPGRERGGWMRMWGRPAGVIHLRDGRWLVARVRPEHRPRAPPSSHARPPRGGRRRRRLPGGTAPPPASSVCRRASSPSAPGGLSARVRVEGHDEVARLAESFNRAAARIEELVSAHKTLLANASHELRTPLTRIRMALELLAGRRGPEAPARPGARHRGARHADRRDPARRPAGRDRGARGGRGRGPARPCQTRSAPATSRPRWRASPPSCGATAGCYAG